MSPENLSRQYPAFTSLPRTSSSSSCIYTHRRYTMRRICIYPRCIVDLARSGRVQPVNQRTNQNQTGQTRGCVIPVRARARVFGLHGRRATRSRVAAAQQRYLEQSGGHKSRRGGSIASRRVVYKNMRGVSIARRMEKYRRRGRLHFFASHLNKRVDMRSFVVVVAPRLSMLVLRLRLSV